MLNLGYGIYLKYLDKIEVEKYFDKNNSKILMVLEIEKIDLIKGIYKKDSEENNVDKNLYLVNDTDPTKKEPIVIAGHNGNSLTAYFNELSKLDLNDNIKIHYKDKIYSYKLTKKYQSEKTGELNLSNEQDKIYLTTCSDDNKEQVIYEAKKLF